MLRVRSAGWITPVAQKCRISPAKLRLVQSCLHRHPGAQCAWGLLHADDTCRRFATISSSFATKWDLFASTMQSTACTEQAQAHAQVAVLSRSRLYPHGGCILTRPQ
jgi:hypothetical protein